MVKFARKQKITDSDLWDAAQRAEQGLVDADLGSGVIKQRVARADEGRSGGFRSILLFQAGDKAYFVYGFAKNARTNIRQDELQGFRQLAEEVLGYSNAALARAVHEGALIEVKNDDQDLSQ